MATGVCPQCQVLPDQLLARCPMLRRLVIGNVVNLHGLPASLEVLQLRSCSICMDWTPLGLCTNLRDLSI